MTDLDRFIQAYIEALYFTDTGDDEQPDSDTELSPETLLDIQADCRSFWRRAVHYVPASDMNPERAGHDFWLTRNGHGAGFWDGDWPEPYAEILTKIAKAYDEMETYLGDDGLIYT